MDRISRKDLYKEAALLISRRSSCLKRPVGAVLVRDGRMIAQGYNGVLPGVPAIQGIDDEGITHTVHAEANIIAFCAKQGIATNNSAMYITLSPCEKCAELIIQAGIIEVYYLENGKEISRIYLPLEKKVSIHNKNSWRDVMEFFNENMSLLEAFFEEYRDIIKS